MCLSLVFVFFVNSSLRSHVFVDNWHSLTHPLVLSFDKIRDKFRAGCQRGVLRGSVLGAFVLGTGMSLSSACPGMVLAQIGAGQPNSVYTVAGGLLGCLVYGSVEKSMREFVAKGYMFPSEKRFADEFLGWTNKVPLMITGLGLFALAASGVIEAVVPWDGVMDSDRIHEVDFPNSVYEHDACLSNPLRCRSWPPSISGAILGSLQLILMLRFTTCMGSATAYQSIVAAPFLLFGGKGRKKMVEDKPWLKYLVTFTPASVELQWQILWCTFCCIGAFASASMSGTYGTVPGLSALECFLGGLFMLFGGRLTAGCTSSHGISGCALLQNASFVAVPAMFGGGIVSGFIIKAIQGDSFYPAYSV